MSSRKLPTGIRLRHSRSCRPGTTGSCSCTPAYEAGVYLARDRKKVRATFATLDEAKAWLVDKRKEKKDRTLRAPTAVTLRDAAEAWLDAIDRGEIQSRSRRPFKPSVRRGYRADFHRYILPDLGGAKVSAVGRADVQALVDRLVGQGLSGSKVRNVVVALNSFYRRACRPGGEVTINPTLGLELPAPAGTRDRVASPEEAAKLTAALPETHRALWATAFYAGLRLGELRALRWCDVADDTTTVHVRRSWDAYEGPVDPKSAKGTRKVPVPSQLRALLLRHRLLTRRGGDDLVFGRTPGAPFTPTHVRKVALDAWAACDPPLDPITLHECRHTYVSLMHDAGLSLERIGDYVGHSSTYMTDRYRHLLDGHEAEARRVLDDYLLARTTGAHPGNARIQAVRH